MACDEAVVTFSDAVQGLGALREAAYRFIAEASCIIDYDAGRYVCRLSPKAGTKLQGDQLRLRFIDVVADENLREKLSRETGPLRDVIVSLAFGALAAGQHQSDLA